MIFNLFRNFFKKISFLLFVLINSFLFSCSNSINQSNNMQSEFENPSMQTLPNVSGEKYLANPVKNPVNNYGKKRGLVLGFFAIAAVALAVALGVTSVKDKQEVISLQTENTMLLGQNAALEQQLVKLNEGIYNSGGVLFEENGTSILKPCSSLYPNCQNCNIQNCKVCNIGYSLDSNNACTCNVSAMTSNGPNCATCSNPTTCTSCNTGYSLKTGSCSCDVSAMTSNGPNCATCSNPTTCTGCQSGYNLSNVYNACGTCTALPAMPNCKNCSNPANTCTECFVGSVQDINGEAVC
jgi:hypothetical protein